MAQCAAAPQAAHEANSAECAVLVLQAEAARCRKHKREKVRHGRHQTAEYMR